MKANDSNTLICGICGEKMDDDGVDLVVFKNTETFKVHNFCADTFGKRLFLNYPEKSPIKRAWESSLHAPFVLRDA